MKKLLKVIIVLILIATLTVFSINRYVINSYKDKIIDIEKLKDINNFDAIVVLGAKVNENNQISLMLKDRLDKAIEVFDYNITDTILMSGDGTKDTYNEPIAMSNYIEIMDTSNVNILKDNKGLSTYDSMYRLKSIYNYKKVLIITQEYHLYRSLYIANELGIDAYGISARKKEYKKQFIRDLREILARNKDFVLTLIKYEV